MQGTFFCNTFLMLWLCCFNLQSYFRQSRVRYSHDFNLGLWPLILLSTLHRVFWDKKRKKMGEHSISNSRCSFVSPIPDSNSRWRIFIGSTIPERMDIFSRTRNLVRVTYIIGLINSTCRFR